MIRKYTVWMKNLTVEQPPHEVLRRQVHKVVVESGQIDFVVSESFAFYRFYDTPQRNATVAIFPFHEVSYIDSEEL